MKNWQDSLDAHQTGRRQLITGVVVGLGALAASRAAHAAQSTMKETPGTAANQSKTSLHYEAEYKVAPQRIYHVLLDPKEFAALTGLPAEIDAKEGGAFSLFGGQIVGRNVELIPGERIVQAWRPSRWDPGVYSIVRFDLKTHGAGSVLALEHIGFPAGLAEHLDQGWHAHYLDPLSKYFA